MTINVWNRRFLEGENYAPAPPMISAKLARNGSSLDGTITNQAEFAISNVKLRTKDGVIKIGGSIEPGASATVSAVPVPDPYFATTQVARQDRWGLAQEHAAP